MAKSGLKKALLLFSLVLLVLSNTETTSEEEIYANEEEYTNKLKELE
jgi:hypothetical protein